MKFSKWLTEGETNPKIKKILSQIEDLGFENMVSDWNDTEKGDYTYWIADVDKARSELSKEEFSTKEYKRILSLVEKLWDEAFRK